MIKLKINVRRVMYAEEENEIGVGSIEKNFEKWNKFLSSHIQASERGREVEKTHNNNKKTPNAHTHSHTKNESLCRMPTTQKVTEGLSIPYIYFFAVLRMKDYYEMHLIRSIQSQYTQ